MNEIDGIALACSVIAAASAIVASWQAHSARRSVREQRAVQRPRSRPFLEPLPALAGDAALIMDVGRGRALHYDGPAEIVTLQRDHVSWVVAHLLVEPPAGDRFGRWFGQLHPQSGDTFDGPIDLVEVIVRLPDGRRARAVLKGKSAGPRPALDLVGSGPPPF